MFLEIDLPNEILEAAAQNKLAFFCGAGISKNTGLPLFNELTENAFKSLYKPLPKWDYKKEKFYPEPVEPHEIAYCNKQFDKAFELLEKKVTRKVVRNWLRNHFKKRVKKGSLELHKALLTLASTNGSGEGHRIVTTNYDDRFNKAFGKKLISHDAPRLAPPRQQTWNNITFLHGRFDKSLDPDGDNLILSSGDFGNAYLRDAWAARFVIELFREFTVLFVGYSVDDPVMGYILDAFSSQAGGGQFKRAYAIDAYATGKEVRKRAEWGAKSVIPILFDAGSKRDDFSPLTRSFIQWADNHKDGLDGSRKLVVDIGRSRPPSSGPNLDNKLEFLTWNLFRGDGKVARAFAHADNPPCDIGWLEHFDKYQSAPINGEFESKITALPTPIQNRSEIDKDGNKIIKFRKPETPLVGINEFRRLATVTSHIGFWLVNNYLFREEFIEWVVRNGGLLNQELKNEIIRKLKEIKIESRTENVLSMKFWNVLLQIPMTADVHMFNNISRNSAFDYATAENKKRILLECLTAAVSVSKPWRYNQNDIPQRLADFANFEICIDDDTILYIWGQISEAEEKKDFLSGLTIDISNKLLEALKLAEFVEDGFVKELNNYCVDALVSSDLEERKTHWNALVLFCTQACRAEARAGNFNVLDEVLSYWKLLWNQTEYVLFARLLIFITSEITELEIKLVVEVLLKNDGQLLKREDCKKEILRFFRLRGRDLSETQTATILNLLYLDGQDEQNG